MPFLRKRPEMRGGLWRRRKSEPNKSAAMHTQHCETNNYWNKRLRRCVTSSKVTETVTSSRHTACSTTSLSNLVTMRQASHSNPRANNRDEWWSKGRQPPVITSKLTGERSRFDLRSTPLMVESTQFCREQRTTTTEHSNRKFEIRSAS